MHRFKELEIWKRSCKFSFIIYELIAKFPDSEKFSLTNQLRRAPVSIPSNITEGSPRHSNKDFARFLEITLGSAYEIETQLLISFYLSFISKSDLYIASNELNEIIKMISKFKSTLKI